MCHLNIKSVQELHQSYILWVYIVMAYSDELSEISLKWVRKSIQKLSILLSEYAQNILLHITEYALKLNTLYGEHEKQVSPLIILFQYRWDRTSQSDK